MHLSGASSIQVEPLAVRRVEKVPLPLFEGDRTPVLFLGHLVGLFTPIAVFEVVGISHGFKQSMANVIGGAAGATSLVGLVLLLLGDRTGAGAHPKGSFGDGAILVLILIQLGLGLSTILYALVEYADGCRALPFMWWAQSIAALKPAAAAEYAVQIPLIFKLHIINGMTIMLVFPFTRFVNIWSVSALLVNHRSRNPLG